MKNPVLFLILFILIVATSSCEKSADPDNKSETITDIDGNEYNTVVIGTQTWMKENLKVTKYNNGTTIQLITDDGEWIKIDHELDKDAYCWYENDRSTYGNTYGALYNWYAVELDNICPVGWHLPTDAEWTTLVDYLGGASVAGGKMKEAGTTHWRDPNEGADNTSGFTALPGGGRPHIYGHYEDIGTYGAWWSQPEVGDTSPTSLGIGFGNESVSRGTTFSTYGHSVRCIKD